MYEKYLSCVSNDSDRRNLSRFRTSSHRLQIEVGRYTVPKTLAMDRLCKQCSMNSVEDETHFLMECPKYTDLRNLLIGKHLSNNVNMFSCSISLKFLWLMSNEDEHLCKDIARFITSGLSQRDQ